MKDRKRNTEFQKSSSRGFPGLANLRRCLSAVWHPARSSLHTYSLGRERAKANREPTRPLLGVVPRASTILPGYWRRSRLGRVSRQSSCLQGRSAQLSKPLNTRNSARQTKFDCNYSGVLQ